MDYPRSFPRFFSIISRCFLFCLVLLGLAGCENQKSSEIPGQKQGKNIAPAVPVTVGTVVQRVIPVQLRTIGTVEPYATVEIKSQITAQLTNVHFQEGQTVKKGDILFTLDARSYEATIRQVEANLASETIQMQQLRKEADRKMELRDKKIISTDEYDKLRTSAEALEASVRADTAALEYARLQRSYCNISSPITGRTGTLLVDSGNLLKANDATMVVINQINPIYVTFSLAENELPDIKKYSDPEKAGRVKGLEVLAFIPTEPQQPEIGTLSFIDNKVDRSTGTISLKGTFENKNERLWPGQFVNVTLVLAYKEAILVPSQAVQTGQIGTYAFVVKSDLTVESRQIEIEKELERDTIVSKGLQANEIVVTDGQLRLIAGSKVEIKKEKGQETGESKTKETVKGKTKSEIKAREGKL